MAAGAARVGTSGVCSEVWRKVGKVADCGELCVEQLVDDALQQEEPACVEFSRTGVVRELEEEEDEGI